MAAVVSSLPKDITSRDYSREAMIKCRFADTIAKAKLSLLTSTGTSVDQKLRIESEVKAATTQLKQQREASRLALAHIESSVSIDNDDNVKTFQELKHLCGRQVLMGDQSSLESLGLFLKKDYEEWEETEERERELMKQRQAQRHALQMVESSAHIDDNNCDIERQLEQLCGWDGRGLKWIFQGYPLLGIDLVLKRDEDDDLDV